LSKYNVAVVGATGAVGNEMIKILEERKFPVKSFLPLASQKSLGKTVEFAGKPYPVQVLDPHSFREMDIALFSAGSAISKEFAPIAASSNCVVIDNTSCFRMDPEVPLVVPEVNGSALAQYEKRGIIANPNCSTIQMVMVLKPIHDAATVNRVVVSTYQSVSGAGQRALAELSDQTLGLFQHKDICAKVFPQRIAFNCLPHIGKFTESGYTEEEEKMIHETQKILDPEIRVSATTVRVPVFYSHSEAVNIETKNKISATRARELLSAFPGIKVVDDPLQNEYPMAMSATGKDEVLVGRIREDTSIENGLDLWICADNLRKGAALNAVQIAEILIDQYL
jgi:aspartate-semialdehyde dehydrogenase